MAILNQNEMTRLQGAIAVASFAAGIIIAVVCLFLIEPKGAITNSAISIVSELLVLCGAILGVKASFDTKLQQFEARIIDKTTSNKETI